MEGGKRFYHQNELSTSFPFRVIFLSTKKIENLHSFIKKNLLNLFLCDFKVSMNEIVHIDYHSISQDPEMNTFNASQFFDNLPNTNSPTFLNIESTSNPIITQLNTIQGIPENFALEVNNDNQKSNQVPSYTYIRIYTYI